MKVLIVEPLKEAYVKDIDPSLESMQSIVGGLIQAIYPFEDGEVAVICNEEGKLLGLPPNRALFDENGNLYDVICGTFFICAAPHDSENFESLPDDKLEHYKSMFDKIEIYIISQ